jgi:hypothetical protein
LLRSKQYLYAVLIADTEQVRQEHEARLRIQDGLLASVTRFNRFVDQPLLRVHVVITEAALRREIGSRQVMLTQWLHLWWATSWEAVTLQVLPAAMTPTTLHDFRLLRFDDSDEPARLFFDQAGKAASQTTAARAVNRAAHQMDLLAAASLSMQDSAAFLRDLVREVGSPGLTGKNLADLLEWTTPGGRSIRRDVAKSMMRRELG